MGTVNNGIDKLAMIAIILIFVVYFVGFSTDAKAVGGLFAPIFYSITGRNAQGNFAGYPTGGSANASAQNTPPAARGRAGA